MDNIASDQSKRNPYPCRKCGQQIYWHKAASGKHYPTDSATDRKAFHQCKASIPPIGGVDRVAQPKPKNQSHSSCPNSFGDVTAKSSEIAPKASNPKPITPDYFEATLEQRVESLEKQLAGLVRTVQEVQRRQPITSQDVGF